VYFKLIYIRQQQKIQQHKLYLVVCNIGVYTNYTKAQFGEHRTDKQEQNRTDILFLDVYKVHSHNTIYIYIHLSRLVYAKQR